MRWLPPAHCQTLRAQRLDRLTAFGFTPRQAAFIGHVVAYSGVFVERQYRTFAGLVHGQQTHDFLRRLVDRGYATVITPGALHRGRLFHLQYKPFYEAFDDPDNRNRKPAALGRFIERLMILDAVLADQRYAWLGTARDKLAYFRAAFGDDAQSTDPWWQAHVFSHLTFGAGREKTTRLFPDKVPIGIPDPHQRYHVFLYVASRPVPTAFRDFLLRHIDLLKHVDEWAMRVAIPRRFRKSAGLYRYAIRDAFQELPTKDCDELLWYYAARAGRPPTPRSPYGQDEKTLAATYRAARYDAIYRAWLQDGEAAVSKLRSDTLREQLRRGRARIEFVELPYQYLQLTHLLDSTAVRGEGEMGTDNLQAV